MIKLINNCTKLKQTLLNTHVFLIFYHNVDTHFQLDIVSHLYFQQISRNSHRCQQHVTGNRRFEKDNYLIALDRSLKCAVIILK